MDLTGDQLAAVDARILALSRKVDRAWGTVAYHSGNFFDREALVTFDGASVAVPCRLSASVEVQGGDRVTCDRYADIWVVTHNFYHRWYDSQFVSQSIGVGTNTSGTFVTLPGSPLIIWQKYYNDTRISVVGTMSSWAGVANDIMAFGVRVTHPNGTVATYFLSKFSFNDAGKHLQQAGATIITSAAFTATGGYSIEPLWAKLSGTQINTDANDWVTMIVTEIQP